MAKATKAKTKTQTKTRFNLKRRIASWQDEAGEDDAYLDAVFTLVEGKDARVDYRLVIRERIHTGQALFIPLSPRDALIFAAAGQPFDAVEAQKRSARERQRHETAKQALAPE